MHLALNMYALYLFGPPLEAALGRLRFIVLYLVSALGGSALSYAFANPATALAGRVRGGLRPARRLPRGQHAG